MIKIEIKIKEDSIQDFNKVIATSLNVTMKEKVKRGTKGELEALKLYKKKMGFDNNLLVVNRCKNDNYFNEVRDQIIEKNV